MTNLIYLSLTWSVSRGRDTYGYNICRLDSPTKRYKCMGGGYDMVGTVFGKWLQDNYQERLVSAKVSELYGASLSGDGTSVRLDGACGLECMLSVAKRIGLDVTRTYNKKGHTTGWVINDAK